MQFLGAHVDFTATQPGGLNGAVNFADAPNEILGMYVRDHEVVGVWSKVIGPAPSLPGGLQFDLLFGPLFPPQGNIFGAPHGDLGDFLASPFQTTSLFLVSGGCTPGSHSNPCVQSNPASTRFVVPEPGSMALVLGALGIAGLVGVTRRRVPRPLLAA